MCSVEQEGKKEKDEGSRKKGMKETRKKEEDSNGTPGLLDF